MSNHFAMIINARSVTPSVRFPDGTVIEFLVFDIQYDLIYENQYCIITNTEAQYPTVLVNQNIGTIFAPDYVRVEVGQLSEPLAKTAFLRIEPAPMFEHDDSVSVRIEDACGITMQTRNGHPFTLWTSKRYRQERIAGMLEHFKWDFPDHTIITD